jgi:hypothetical protein
MRYVVRSPWPVSGGAAVISGGVVIDDSTHPFLSGVVPPPDSEPLDQATRDWLVAAYRAHGFVIAPVGSG